MREFLNTKILTRILALALVSLVCRTAAAQTGTMAQTAGQYSADSLYLTRAFSSMDIMTLKEMEKNAEAYRQRPDFADYTRRLSKAAADLQLYDRATGLLNSPFDFARIVEVRKTLIPLITQEGYFSEAQQAEMDRIDILLSRYKGSVALFQDIIGRINSDPVVTAYRAAARKGRPSGEERRKYIAAISSVVYKPSTKEFTEEINSYIQLIPYLKPRLTEYLNSIAQYPETTPAVEAEISAYRIR